MRGTLTINFDPPYFQFLPSGHAEAEGLRYCTRDEIRLLLELMGVKHDTLNDGVIRMDGDFEMTMLLSLRLLPARSA